MCIPVNAVKPLIESVLSGEIEAIAPEADKADTDTTTDLTGKPRLGVKVYNVNTSSRAAMLGQIPDGVFIEVEAGGPADKAGLRNGDIIVDVNDTIITDTDQLIKLVGQYKAGDVLKVKVYRTEENLMERSANEDVPDGEYIDVEVTLEIVESSTAAQDDASRLFEE